jgi:hypothetical protein
MITKNNQGKEAELPLFSRTESNTKELSDEPGN